MSAPAAFATTAADALDALPLAICLYGPSHRLVFANAAAAALFGDEAPAPGAALQEVARALARRGVLGPGDPEGRAAAHLAGGRALPVARLLRGTDGATRVLRAVPLAAGGFCETLLDIPDGDIAGSLARAALLETVLAHLDGGLALYDEQRRLLVSNPRYEALIGLPAGTVRPGMTQEEVLRLLAAQGELPDAEAKAAVAARLATSIAEPFSYQRARSDGRVLEISGRPVAATGHLIEIDDITALAEAEREARRRAALIDGVLAALPNGVLVYGPDQRVTMVNAAYLGIMADQPVAIGEHREAIVLRRARAGEFGPPGDDPAALGRAVMAETETRGHRRQKRPNGTVLDVRSALLPDGGRVLVITDVTPLDEAEAAARERAALLQVMLDNMRHGIALFDRERRLVTANALAARFCGLTPTQMAPGRPFEALVADQIAAGEFTAEAVEQRSARREERERGGSFAYRRVRPDGMVIEVVTDPTPDGAFVVTYSDVTARARAEAEARDRAELLQTTIDHLRQGIIVYGADRRVRVSNRQAEEIAGHRPGAIRPGRTLEELVREMIPAGALEPGPEGEAAVGRIMAYDRSRPATTIRTARGGRVIAIHSDPLPDGGFIVSHIDITPLAHAEAEARQRAAMLQATLDNMRHGIALYGPDRRLRLVNALAASLSGLAREDLQPGRSMDALVDLQLARGFFGAGEEAAAVAARLKVLDRSLHHSAVRRLPDGRVVEHASDPTPDGGFVVTWSDITARAEAEAAAQRRAAMLQGTLDGVRHSIVLYGPDRRLLVANRLAIPALGLPQLEGRVGWLFEDLVREQLALGVFGAGEEAERSCAAVLALDRSKPIRYQRTLPDGRTIAVASDPTPDGGFVITHSDVTELLQAQAEAAQRAQLLQVMLDHMRHGIVLYGPDRRVVAANALVADLGGHAPGDVVPGRLLDDLIREQASTGAVGGDSEAFAAMALGLDRATPHRYVRRHRDGRSIEVTSDPAPDGGFVITMSDVSALAEAEAEAKRRAGMQQVMLDNIRHGILLVDHEGEVVAANRVFCQLLGIPAEIVAAGRPFTDFVDWLEARGEYGTGPEAAAVAAAIRTRDRGRPIRTVRTRPDGMVLEAVSDPTPDGGWVLTFTDISAERRAQAELERARDAAEAANRAKSRFLATMSHELRTPLNAVIGFSEALLAGPRESMDPAFVRSIHEAGRHLLSLIDDILDVTRAETTGFQVAEGEVNLEDVVAGALRVMAATAATAKVALQDAIEPGLPQLRADELRLRQVLLNLLSNAVKFTPAGGSVTVSALRDRVRGGVTIRIADTGIGMAPEDIPRAFEPFTQLDATLSRRFSGSGLGLYLSRALATAQGAELSLESRPGAGTTAVLHFPSERVAGAPRG